MSLPWVRLDTQFAQNPKILALVEAKSWRAITVYVAGLGYCGAHGTDGLIPKSALPYLHGTPADAIALVGVALWMPHQSGWTVNDWAAFQQSTDETKARQKRLAYVSKKANCIRWHGKNCGCWERGEGDVVAIR
jgi:hypothetical protein